MEKSKENFGGEVQVRNAVTVLSAIHILRTELGVDIIPEAVHEGFRPRNETDGIDGTLANLAIQTDRHFATRGIM